MNSGRAQRCISRKQRSLDCLGKRKISVVVGGEILAELPDPREQHIVRIARDAELAQVPKRQLSSRIGEFAATNITP